MHCTIPGIGYKAYYTFVPNEDNEFVAPDGATIQNTAPQQQSNNQGMCSCFFFCLLCTFSIQDDPAKSYNE